MKLYKFLPKRHLDNFFSYGNLRLGTVYDFKDEIKHTSARGDSNEGKKTVRRQLDGTPIHLKHGVHIDVISDVFSGNVTITGTGSVSSQRVCNDAFIFCTSNEFSEELFSLWYADSIKSGANDLTDACYEIYDVQKFFSAISFSIRHKALPLYGDHVIYTTDPIPHDSLAAKLHPAMIKEINEYGWQKENRSIWQPINHESITPWVLDVPAAREFCRPFALLSKNDDRDQIRYISL